MEFESEKKILHLVNATLRRSWRIFVVVQVTFVLSHTKDSDSYLSEPPLLFC